MERHDTRKRFATFMNNMPEDIDWLLKQLEKK